MLNCFLHDESLHNRVTGTYSDTDIDSGHGYLTDYLKSYFQSPKTLVDTRADRLDVDGESTYRMKLHFDGDKDLSGIDFSAITQSERDALFNIIEALAYNLAVDAAAFETLFAGSGATFGIYSVETLQRSITNASKNFYIDSVTAAATVNVRGWVQFDCTLDGVEETIKVWFSNSEFAVDYPDVTFTHITYPDDPSRLLTGTYTGAQAMAAASAYSTTDIDTVVSSTDNTGAKVFSSVYNPGGISNVLNPSVSFIVFYKGKEPTNQQVRDHIRTELVDLALADENTWKDILPDLFVNGRHFIVPLWDNSYDLPGGGVLRQGIMNYENALDMMEVVFATYDPVFVKANLEILLSSASEMFLIALPSEDNEPGDRSLLADYETYQAIDGTIPYFENQSIETQSFNIALAGAIAVATGATNTLTFSEDEFEGREWITFSANFKEYHVLKSDQYPSSY